MLSLVIGYHRGLWYLKIKKLKKGIWTKEQSQLTSSTTESISYWEDMIRWLWKMDTNWTVTSRFIPPIQMQWIGIGYESGCTICCSERALILPGPEQCQTAVIGTGVSTEETSLDKEGGIKHDKQVRPASICERCLNTSHYLAKDDNGEEVDRSSPSDNGNQNKLHLATHSHGYY